MARLRKVLPTDRRPAFRGVVTGTLIAVAVSLLAAASADAQAQSQQPGRPQPPPAPTTAAQPAASGGPAQPQAPVASKPQPPGAAKPQARKTAPPQTSKSWKGRGFAVVAAGAQVATEGYTSTSVFTVHAEDATLTADATIGIGPAFAARAGMRVWKNLALGGGVSVVTASQSLDVTGRLPHPFQFNQPREVEGTADGLERVETLAAFEVSWLVAVSRRIDMLVFGGPAYLRVRQDMATRIQFTESYPYDTATYTGVETVSMSGGGVGVTGGVDVAYLLSRHLGIGGELRYSYASTTLTPSKEPSTVPLGGLQVAVAARILF
jgi:hypothetical protein